MLNSYNIYGSPTIDKTEQIIYANGKLDHTFERRCCICKNLVYMNIKNKEDDSDASGKKV